MLGWLRRPDRRLERHGVAMMRGVLPPAVVAHLATAADALYSRLAAPGDHPAELKRSHDAAQFLIGDLAAAYSPESGAALERAAVALNVRLPKWRWRLEASAFRRVGIGATGATGWHCDAEAASLNEGGRWITCWAPLVAVGQYCPGLEFVETSHRVLSARPPREPDDANHRSAGWVSSVPGRRWAPSVNPGDVLVFDEFTLHRTQMVPALRSRTSCELRFKLG